MYSVSYAIFSCLFRIKLGKEALEKSIQAIALQCCVINSILFVENVDNQQSRRENDSKSMNELEI